MRISVIIPCYRCEATIQRCADSLYGESYRDCEFIFVDDGGEVEGLEDVVAQDSRARLLKIPHGGVSRARNAGLEAAAGEYVTFCDADDYMGKELLRAYADTIGTHGADWVFTDVVSHSGTSHSATHFTSPEGAEACLKAFFDGNLSGSLCDKCYRLDLIRHSGLRLLEGVGMWEDWCFNVEYALKAGCIEKVTGVSEDDMRYHYVSTAGSATRSQAKFSTGMGACASVRRIEQVLIQAGRYDAWFQGALMGGKLLAKDYFLSCGAEGLAAYHRAFPEANSLTWIWRLTRGKRASYRWKHLLAASHLFWIYRLVKGGCDALRRCLGHLRPAR